MKKQKAIFVEIDFDLALQLDELKQKEERSLASLVRIALRKYLESAKDGY